MNLICQITSHDVSLCCKYDCDKHRHHTVELMFICGLRLEEFYSYTEKIQQKRTRKTKQNKTKENYVQRTTIYNNHIDTQQINSSGTAYLLMC